MKRRSLLQAGLALGASMPMTKQVHAQSWPQRPIRIVVPFAAGSFTDTAARTIGKEISSMLGQPVVIETKGGGGSTLGTNVVAKSDADGYSLLVTDNSFAVSSALYAKLPYDPQKDIVQITTVAEAPAVIMVNKDSPYTTLKDLVEVTRKNPKKFTYGSGGQGSSAHLALELFFSGVQAELIHVPYKGVAAALLDLIAGRIDVGLASAGSAANHVRNGRLRALAVAGTQRHPMLPDVPTFAEAGFPQYNMTYWFGLMAPAGLPLEVQQKLQQSIAKAVQEAKVMEVFAATGARAVASTPAEFSQRVNNEISVWKGVIAKAGIRIE